MGAIARESSIYHAECFRQAPKQSIDFRKIACSILPFERAGVGRRTIRLSRSGSGI